MKCSESQTRCQTKYKLLLLLSIHVLCRRVYMLYTCTECKWCTLARSQGIQTAWQNVKQPTASLMLYRQLALLIAGQAFSLHSKVLTTQVHDVETEKNKFVCIPLDTVVAICTNFFNIFSTDTSKLGSVKCGDFWISPPVEVLSGLKNVRKEGARSP